MEEIKNTNITEDRIENRVQLTKVYLGSGDDYIILSGNDISLFDKFLDAGNKIISLSEEAANVMNSVLGEGATRKFFRDVYKEIPDFLPDVECFLDFFDSLIPVIEKLTGHKEKLEKLASKRRMSKYKPQDYKKAVKE